MSIFKKIKLGELLDTVADVATAVVPGGNLVGGVVKGVIDAVDGDDDDPGKKHGNEGNRRANRRHRAK